jgi:protein-S-isoprenylcysteine O-methyltransferase Ste14
MAELISRFAVLPAYSIGALLVILLFAVQSEIRFGARARTMRPAASDRKSTLALSISSLVALLGFVLAMKADSPVMPSALPDWFRHAVLPGLPALAWLGVIVGCCGLALRLWSLLTLKERFTRTLLVQDHHAIERGGPYRWVRHPGYLGSLLCLNGVALASGNWITLAASLAATGAAYGYRIWVEEHMLTAALGPAYAEYRSQVRALLLPFRRPPTVSDSQPKP